MTNPHVASDAGAKRRGKEKAKVRVVVVETLTPAGIVRRVQSWIHDYLGCFGAGRKEGSI